MLPSGARSSTPRAVAFAIAAAGVAAAPGARADELTNLWKGRPEPFCPLIFGAGCGATLSVDVVLAHQPVWSDDNGRETYLRAGGEVALGKLVAPSFQVGPALEIGGQDGQFMTGFHIVPKARGRYWLGGSGVSVDLAFGSYLGRSWLDTGDAARNWLGAQVDAGFGLMGFLNVVGGFAVIADPGGIYSTQTQAFVGARFSILTIAMAAYVVGKR